MEMTILEYDGMVQQKLKELADTEKNRKKYQKIKELDALRKSINAKEQEIKEAIEKEEYDLAVTLKTELAQMETKEIMMAEVVNEIRKDSDYDLEDLKKMCRDTMQFYEAYRMELLKQRLPILKELENNMELLKEAERQFDRTVEKIEKNMPGYGPFKIHGRCVSFSVMSEESETINKRWRLEKYIAEQNGDNP